MFAIHEMLVAAKQYYVLNGIEGPIEDKTNRTRTNTTFLYILLFPQTGCIYRSIPNQGKKPSSVENG
ncbi:hypothetical protein L1887_35832 [Cichorium endivia]|nr:hypothetical protein L1887_35832 [Cichorium endivia]